MGTFGKEQLDTWDDWNHIEERLVSLEACETIHLFYRILSVKIHSNDDILQKMELRVYLMPYTMGLYTALALAKREPQIVKSGLILVVSKMPAKLMTRYGVHAINHKEMVMRATYN